MALEGDNVDASLLQSSDLLAATSADGSAEGSIEPQRGHGHYFKQKSFGKPTYCHHCTELLWSILQSQPSFVCEVCNFTCHEKCLKTVASYCSGVAMQLIKNPVAHCWSEPQHIKRRFCCVCRKRLDDSLSLECEVCEYNVHVDCQDLAVSDCKEPATYVPSLEPSVQVQHHHFREGNLPSNSKCAVCKKTCWSAECLAGMRCEWCGITAHATCYKQLQAECGFGFLHSIMLPPNCLTIPRTELPMEQLLSISRKRDATGGKSTICEDSGSNEFEKEKEKEKEDCESVRIFDGNASLEKGIFRVASIPKTATAQQIKETAMKTFHIQDNASHYYVTQVVSEDGQEERMDELMPLRSVFRLDGKRAHLFLRYADTEEHRTNVKIYGGWLRIPVTFCNVSVPAEFTIEDVIKDALVRFGLNSSTSQLYNLAEVSLERGIVERYIDNNETLFKIIQEMRRNSLRQFQCSRFYLQEKEDPHGSNVALFVGNLPSSLSQRQYEKILLRLLGATERSFTSIGPIYYEYGSLVVTFNTPKIATKACLKLQNAVYEDKKLLVVCLPNIQPHMIPPDVEPLMVLVNVKSGGCQGSELIRSFRKQLNPLQVFDILNGGPLVGLYVFRNIPKYKILVCGDENSHRRTITFATIGDGTVGWVLQCLDIVGQDSVCSSPPCAIVPLGTGNDLARVLRWGPGYTGQEDSLSILRDVTEADEISLDRWTVVFHCEERSEVLPGSSGGAEQAPELSMQMNNPEDQTSMIIMNNYFGIGIDADVCLGFHKEREENPDKFNSRLHNKGVYAIIGIKKMINRKLCKELHKKIKLEVDGKQVELPSIEGIIVLNIMSWGSGVNPWGQEKEEPGFQKPTHYDGQLEVVGVTSVMHLGQIQSRLSNGIRIAQGGHIRIQTMVELPVQVDGEPQMQPPGTITILKSALKATMLKKSKIKRRNTEPHLASRYPQSGSHHHSVQALPMSTPITEPEEEEFL